MVLLRCLLGGEEQQHWHTRAQGAHGTGLYSKFLWSARKVLCVARALKLAGSARGQFLLVCLLVSREFCLAMLVAILWVAQSSSPQIPNRFPESLSSPS
jgi:hypothetical protein